MLGCKPVKIHLDPSQKVNKEGLVKNDVLLNNITEYRKLIGNLIYLTVTRPNMSYTVLALSQFMHSPRKSHLEIALRLLRYIKFSPGTSISILKNSSYDIFSFVDVDWAKCLSTRRSVTGYCVYFRKFLVFILGNLLFLGKLKTKT